MSFYILEGAAVVQCHFTYFGSVVLIQYYFTYMYMYLNEESFYNVVFLTLGV